MGPDWKEGDLSEDDNKAFKFLNDFCNFFVMIDDQEHPMNSVLERLTNRFGLSDEDLRQMVGPPSVNKFSRFPLPGELLAPSSNLSSSINPHRPPSRI